MLLNLSLEILQMICNEISSPRDLANLASTCKRLNYLVSPALYESLTIKTAEDRVSANSVHMPYPLKTWFRLDGSKSYFLTISHVKSLVFLAETAILERKRCMHGQHHDANGDILDVTPIRYDTDHERVMRELGSHLMHGIFHLSDNCLRSFVWELGCCIPERVINYMVSHQTKIQELAIVTDATCTGRSLKTEGLISLNNLHHLSWTGFNPMLWSSTLQKLMQENAINLRSLQIGVVFNEEIHIHLAKFDHYLQSNGVNVIFPSLRDLSLSNMSLKFGFERLSNSIHFNKLHSLRLIQCGNSHQLLKKLSNPSNTPLLRSLEVVQDEIQLKDMPLAKHPLVRFLKSFQGLEQAYLSLKDMPGTLNVQSLIQVLMVHKSTLKRLILHERVTEGENSDFGEEYSNMTFDAPSGIEDETIKYFKRMDLECFGLCFHPSTVMRAFQGRKCFQNLKLLHIRLTGGEYKPRHLMGMLKRLGFELPNVTSDWSLSEEADNDWTFEEHPECQGLVAMKHLLDLAKWAFGPKGLPKLMILAYGDFSNRGRFDWTHIKFCRNLPPERTRAQVLGRKFCTFRAMEPKDEYLWGQINGGSEVIRACPIEITEYDDGEGITFIEDEEVVEGDSQDGDDTSNDDEGDGGETDA